MREKGHEKSPKNCSEILADEGQFEGLDGFGFDTLEGRLERYAGGKERALRVSEYIKMMQNNQNLHHFKLDNLADSIKNCASYLVFKHYLTVDEVRLLGVKTCKKHLLCPFCAMRRATKYLRVYLEKIDYLYSENLINRDLKPYFVTLTVKDEDDLDNAYMKLKKGFECYGQMRRNTLKGLSSCEYGKAEGGVFSYETKKGARSGLWHPHLHAIWWCLEPPDARKISEEWLALTGDSFIVDVRPLKSREVQNSLVAGFIEVFKYALKFSDMSIEDTFHAFTVLQRKRLIGSFGFLRGVVVPDELTDEDLEGDLPYVELFYKYADGNYDLLGVNEVSSFEEKGDVVGKPLPTTSITNSYIGANYD